jgi:hypothetical protein
MFVGASCSSGSLLPPTLRCDAGYVGLARTVYIYIYIYTPYMNVYLVISLPKITCVYTPYIYIYIKFVYAPYIKYKWFWPPLRSRKMVLVGHLSAMLGPDGGMMWRGAVK